MNDRLNPIKDYPVVINNYTALLDNSGKLTHNRIKTLVAWYSKWQSNFQR